MEVAFGVCDLFIFEFDLMAQPKHNNPLHVAFPTVSCKRHAMITAMHDSPIESAFVNLITILHRFDLSACPAHLVIRSAAQGELEAADPTSQFPVNLRVSIESVVHATTLFLVQDDLENLASIFLRSESLSNNLNRIDHIGEDGIVNGGQSSAARTLLGKAGAGAVGALGARQDAARGKDQNMTVRELLLQLAGQTLLDLVEAGEEGDRDKDDDGALAVADFELQREIFVSRLRSFRRNHLRRV